MIGTPTILKELAGIIFHAGATLGIEELLRASGRSGHNEHVAGNGLWAMGYEPRPHTSYLIPQPRLKGANLYLFEGDNNRGAIGGDTYIGLNELIGAASDAGHGPTDPNAHRANLPAFATGAVAPALAYIAAPPSATAEQMAAIAALPIAQQTAMAAANRATIYQNIASGILNETNPVRQAEILKDPETQRLAQQPAFMATMKAIVNNDQAALTQAKQGLVTQAVVEIQNTPAHAANNANFLATSILPALQAQGSPSASVVAQALKGADTTAVSARNSAGAAQVIQNNGGVPLAGAVPAATALASAIPGGVSSLQQIDAIAEVVEDRNAGMVVDQTLSSKRRYPLGFVPTDVLTGQTLNIPAAPQNLFRPERLVIPSDIAFDFGVTDIKVGNTSQFVQNVEVPAVLFSEVAINTNVYFDSANIGNQVSVQVRNKSAGTLNFTAGLIGAIAK